MKTYACYCMALLLICIGCTPMNKTIGIRQVYQYPVAKNNFVPASIDVTKTLSIPSQTFVIDSDMDTMLYGKEGTIVFIEPGCLLSNDGTLLKGKITVELKELFTKEALLKERAYTVSNRSMLESDGSIYILAKDEQGEVVQIVCENAIRIRLPKEIQANMIYFEGNRDEGGNMNWNLAETIRPVYEENYIYTDYISEENNPYLVSETEQGLKTYFFSIKNFGWINCDRFYDDPREKVDFRVQIPAPVLPAAEKKILEVYNYIVFDSLMSVIPLYKADSDLWVSTDMPLGASITCISIQKSRSHLYYGVKKTIIGDRESTIIELKEIKEQELQKQLDLSL